MPDKLKIGTALFVHPHDSDSLKTGCLMLHKLTKHIGSCVIEQNSPMEEMKWLEKLQ